MIQTLLEARGADQFSLAEMFPVGNDYMGGLSWDYMISQDAAMQQIQACHDLFIEEYDKNPDAYDFTFHAKSSSRRTEIQARINNTTI